MFSYQSPDRKEFRSVKITSRFLTMRDGVRLAVDIIFPQPYDFRKPLPTLIHQTRYWRRPELKWPYNQMLSPLLGYEAGLVKEIIQSGYIFVNVDARGSGASFGSRAHPWTQDEVNDGVEIVDWILQQPWSNGNVGSVGVSYTGTAAEFLASKQHPAVKAFMPLFCLYDVFDDIALPGGVPLEFFLTNWGEFNSMLDRNEFPLRIPTARLLLRGVAPVQGDKKALMKALEDHKANQNVNETSRGVYFRDQAPSNGVVETMDEFSPHNYTDKINEGGAAFLSGSGWFDGGYQHAAIKRFLNLTTPFNKLILGPWSHGGQFHTTPGYSGKNQEAIASMAISLFDHFLKGYDTTVQDLASVNYFTMGQQAWKTAGTWPPPGLVDADLFFTRSGELSSEKPSRSDAMELVHDPNYTTGLHTRWRALAGMVRTHKYYPERKEQTRTLLHFETPPLAQDLEVTGHPMVELWVQSMVEDASIFVYLDDVLPDGEMRYVTEGMIRAMHRNTTAAPAHRDAVPQRSYNREDAVPLDTHAPNRIAFDILPTSYLFKKGHRIRISIATTDKDNFGNFCPPGATYGILTGQEHASKITLPIMPQ